MTQQEFPPVMTIDQAAQFYQSKVSHLYRNWKRLGGKKIPGVGIRFSLAKCQAIAGIPLVAR